MTETMTDDNAIAGTDREFALDVSKVDVGTLVDVAHLEAEVMLRQARMMVGAGETTYSSISLRDISPLGR